MQLPYLKSRRTKSEKQTVVFRGVNYGEATVDGQLEDSRNLQSGKFPCLSPRMGRGQGASYQNATAAWYKDGLLVVDGSDLIYNGEVVGSVSPGKKQFANINTKVVIMPDKVVFDTKTKELRGLGAEYTSVAAMEFAGGDKESTITTHIGSFVESIVGSGNVGGNDTLGEKDPVFCGDAPPFSAVYQNAKVNEDTGVLELTGALEGEQFTAENVQAGYGFVAANLGADGQKKFGRVTSRTEFPATGLPSGQGPYHAWQQYHAVTQAVTKTSCSRYTSSYEEAAILAKPVRSIERVSYTSYRLYLWGYSYPRPVMVIGSGYVAGNDGYWEIENGVEVSVGDSTSLGTYTFGNYPINIYVGFKSSDGKIRDIMSLNLSNTYVEEGEDYDVPGTFELKAVTSTHSYDVWVGDDLEDVIPYLNLSFSAVGSYGSPKISGPALYQTAEAVVTKGAKRTVVYSLSADAYPEEGYSDNYFYHYFGAFDNPRFYGFDYELIAPDDGFESGESGWEKVNFRKGDTVEITGCTKEENNKSATIRDIREEEADGVARHVLVFDGNVFETATEESGVTVARKIPNLSVICESQNRLFGAEGNTIYVSALGDPTNLYTYDGVDTDSYSVAVATEGAFTGCIGYGKSVLFFKEDCMHKLLGDYPSEYTLYDYVVPGVLKNSEESLWNINEVVYYHGREGVYRYAGGAPELLSECFGLRRYANAAAGAKGEHYYISMQDKQSGKWGMWVYDIQKDIWLQEDDTQAVCFARDGGKLYYIDGKDSTLMLVNPEESSEEVAWSATLCRMDEVYLNRKCYSKVMLRADLADKAWMQVEISCDGGVFRKVFTSRNSKAKTLVIPIVPNRCDNFRIRISGEGDVVVRSMVREFSLGSNYN